jgi:hypothetical protein
MILQKGRNFLKLLCAIALASGGAACSTAPRPATNAQPSAAEEAGEAADAKTLEQILRETLARRIWSDLRLDADCKIPAGYRYATLFTSGVGVWNRERQFKLSREEVLGLLRDLAVSDFPRLRERYGEGEERDAEVELTCRVRLELNGVAKEVQQLSRGEQSAALKRLAERILGVAEAAGRSGKGAPSLTAGLDGIARGELAPELLSLQVVRQPETAGDAEGWTLNLSGLRATIERDPAPEGETPLSIELQPSEVAELAGRLAAARLEELPANLWAPEYTDLSVVVLNHRRGLQARRFAGMTPETHGERQQRFDRLWEVLEALRDRLMKRPDAARARHLAYRDGSVPVEKGAYMAELKKMQALELEVQALEQHCNPGCSTSTTHPACTCPTASLASSLFIAKTSN